MMQNPEVSKMLSHDHRREMLAAADRRRLARQVRREAQAAKRARRIASHYPDAHRRQGLRKILLGRVWLWLLG
jgi:hypothetical protein